MITQAEYKRRAYAAKIRAGLRRIEVWAPPALHPKIRANVARLIRDAATKGAQQ